MLKYLRNTLRVKVGAIISAYQRYSFRALLMAYVPLYASDILLEVFKIYESKIYLRCSFVIYTAYLSYVSVIYFKVFLRHISHNLRYLRFTFRAILMAYLSLYLRYTYIVIFTVYFFMISDIYLEYIQQIYTSVIPRDVYRDMRIRATFSISISRTISKVCQVRYNILQA